MQTKNLKLNLAELDKEELQVLFDNKKLRILEILQESTDYLTKIAEKSCISHVVCLYHLGALEELGFVHKIDAGYRKFYLLSDRGRKTLELYRSSF